MRRIFFIGCLSLLLVPATAQIGGRHVYDFLNLAPSARHAAIGGINVSTWDDDPSFAAQNPALLNDSMHQKLALSFVNYLADIGYGYAGYSHTREGIGSFHGAIQYVSYGNMQSADEYGNITGEFSARDLAVTVGYSRTLDRLEQGTLRYGVNLKVISSSLAPGFGSVGIATDLGAAYRSPEKLFSAGLVMKNLGVQLSSYVPGAAREPLPFEIVAGVSNKLRYMPLRFSLTFIQLEHPNLVYIDPNAPIEFDLSGNPIEPPNQMADRIFRHVVFGGEFLLGRSLRLRAGYNHLRRQELRANNRAGMTGFSLGAGIRLRRFAIDYGFSSYGLNSVFNTHQFSVRMNLKGTPTGAMGE